MRPHRPLQSRVAIDWPALRLALGARSISEALERKATGRPSVNAAQMWRYFTTSVYSSGDLPVIATREALQNATDAIRVAIRKRQIGQKEGRFEVTWDADTRTLSWDDNGIGMDTDTILDKFLSLGDSGKSGAADSSEAAGGFGIAKAVILGVSASFRWEMLTRDNQAVSKGASEDVAIYDAKPRQGTRITVFDVPAEFERRYSYARNQYETLLERLRIVLAANDLPEMSIRLNGAEVAPLFSRRGGSRVAQGGEWGAGTTATARAFRRPPGERGGAFYLRVGGLFQFEKSSSAKLPADVVIDLTTTIRPGNSGYPLNAARDQLQAEAGWAFQGLVQAVEQENESAGNERDYDVYLPDPSGAVADATIEALSDPALQQAMRAAAGGLSDYYQELGKQPRSVAEATSNAPQGSRIHTAPDAVEPSDLGGVTAASLAKLDVPTAAKTVQRILSTAGILDSATAAALDRTAAAGQVGSADATTVGKALDEAAQRAVAQSTAPGGVGLLQASAAQQSMEPLRVLLPSSQKRSPFGQLAGLRVSKQNFDKRRAAQFRRDFAKWLPFLVVWDAALRLVAAEARLRQRFSPGFVLDDTVSGMASYETSESGNRQYVVYVHPMTLRSVVNAHQHRPLSIAFWLHGLACHELTHLDGRMGEGHSESYVAAREDLGFATAHLLAPLADLVSRVLQLPSPSSKTVPRPRKAVFGSSRQLADDLADQGLVELEATLLAAPPAGIEPRTLSATLDRFRPTLRVTLSGLIKNQIDRQNRL